MKKESEKKICQNCKQDFVIEPEDFNFYEKISVPPPTFCPECRLVRRLTFRNERKLYWNKCNLCQKKTLSIFSPDKPLVVYCAKCWWGDGWDGLDQGMEYDPSRSFFDQLEELMHKVPFMALHGLWATVVNSDYANMVSYLRNCYLITHSDVNEDCAYGSMLTNSKNCFDNHLIDKCELTYESVNCRRCNRTFFSTDCEDSYDLWYSRNCVGCSNCYGCVNLRNKQYHIFNRPYSKEEYEKKIKEIKDQDPYHLWNEFPQKYLHGSHNNSVSGDYIFNSKNARDCYIVADVEDSRFCTLITPGGMKDCYDFTHYGVQAELQYESLQHGGHSSNCRFVWWVGSSRDVDYSMFVVDSHDMFGCIGLKKKSYCILNKQYSKEEYIKLRNSIKKDMKNRKEYGEFFPSKLTPFAYNETTAQEYFPLTQNEALKRGYQWQNQEKRNYDRGNNILACEHNQKCTHDCTGVFRMIKPEKEFIKRFDLTNSALCPNCRHHRRLQQMNPLKLWHRKCAKENCKNEFATSYAPERPEIVYCEKCYQQEVY